MKTLRFLPLIGLVVFFFILWNINWNEMFSLFGKLYLPLLVLVPILEAPIVAIKAFKWNVLLRPYGTSLSLRRAMSLWLIGFFTGIITPGRMGDFLRAYYIKDRLPLGKAVATVAADRIIDILVLFVLSLLGLVLFSSYYASDYLNAMILVVSTFLALFILAFYAFTKKGVASGLLRPLFRSFVPSRYKRKVSNTFHEFYDGFYMLRREMKVIFVSLLLSILSWILTIVKVYILSVATGINLPFVFVACVLPVITLLDVLPISFSGVGTRDVALIIFFSFLSLSAEGAVLFSFMILIFNYVVSAVFGLTLWLKNPVKLNLDQS